MADINPNNPQDTGIISQFPADERASRSALLDITAGVQFWGGTSGGAASDQTVTVDVTGLTLTAGLTVRTVLGFDITGATNLQVNALTNTAIVDRRGNALGSGVTYAKSGDLAEFVYDGTNFRLMTGVYMEQETYDALLPIGFVQLRFDGTAPIVPTGVSATWSAISDTDRYLRINNGGGGGTGGSATTAGHTLSVAEIPAHTHNVQNNVFNQVGGPDSFALNSPASIQISTQATSSVGGGGSHSHDGVTPKFRDVRAYRRTS